MSWKLNAILITANKIDESEIFSIFNHEIVKAMGEPPRYPDYYPDYFFVKENTENSIYPIGGELVRPYYRYFGQLSINGIVSDRHCYFIEHGDMMFFRYKYPLVDDKTGIAYDLHMKQSKIYKIGDRYEAEYAAPPYEELNEFFTLIFKNNNEVYMMFDDVHFDEKFNDCKAYIEARINTKSIHICSVEEVVSLADTPSQGVEVFMDRLLYIENLTTS